MNKSDLLDALKHEQRQIMQYISLNKGRNFIESWELDYVLEVSLNAIRDYRDGRISDQDTYTLYGQVTQVSTQACVAYGVWKHKEQQKQRDQIVNDTLREWHQKGWIARADDGLWDWVGNARVNVFGAAA